MTQLLVNNLLSRLCEEHEYTQYDYRYLKVIDTQNVLLCLMKAKEFSKSDTEALLNLERQINITGKIVTRYNKKWKPYKSSKALPHIWIDIFTVLLYKHFLHIKSINTIDVELMKVINSVLKCLDLATTSWLKKGSELYKSIGDDFERIANKISQHEHAFNNEFIDNSRNFNKSLVVLPITVLFWEGPIARAYLATIHSMGFEPKKIIHLVASHEIVTKRPVGKLFPETLRKKNAAIIQKQRIHYWPKKIAKYQPELKKTIANSIIEDYQFSQDILDNANELQPLTYFCSNVETLLIKNLRDTLLTERLKQLPESTLLYTGGGMVPKQLLDISNIKLIHIHPGFLPRLRGADCTLWSVLMYDTTSASCFFMDDDIDIGNIILASWLPQTSFKISHNKYDSKTLYRSIYSFFDPWVRSFVLRQVIKKYSGTNFYAISTTKQVKDSGTTLHFMHNKIKDVVMDKLFSH